MCMYSVMMEESEDEGNVKKKKMQISDPFPPMIQKAMFGFNLLCVYKFLLNKALIMH